MPDHGLNFFAQDDAATVQCGKALAQIIQPGDLVLLQGELGAGKSALARAVIRCLLNDPDLVVPSPTYLLVLPYSDIGSLRSKPHHWSILHADLFRLNQPEELADLGLFDDAETVTIVEWPERAPNLFDHPALVISLSIPADGTGRNISLRSTQRATDMAPLTLKLREAK